MPWFLSYMMHVKLFSKLAIPFNNLTVVCNSFQQASLLCLLIQSDLKQGCKNTDDVKEKQ